MNDTQQAPSYEIGEVVEYRPFARLACVVAQSGRWLVLQCLDAACVAAQEAGKAPHRILVLPEELALPGVPATGGGLCTCNENMRCAVHGPHLHRFRKNRTCVTPGCGARMCRSKLRQTCGPARTGDRICNACREPL